jgi:hypothetical protein
MRVSSFVSLARMALLCAAQSSHEPSAPRSELFIIAAATRRSKPCASTVPRDPGGLTREVETPLPSNRR